VSKLPIYEEKREMRTILKCGKMQQYAKYATIAYSRRTDRPN